MEESFHDVFEAEVVQLRRYLGRRLGVDVADDLTAETFAIAYRKWDRIDRQKPVRPWLYGIATKLVLHHRRKERRRLAALARSSVDPLVSNDDPSVVARIDASAQRTSSPQPSQNCGPLSGMSFSSTRGRTSVTARSRPRLASR